VDLQQSQEFEDLGVQLLNISPDPPEAWQQWAAEYPLHTPMLTDASNEVAARYGVMRWRMPPGADIDSSEPGHTFVLIDEEGRVAWVQDYGAAENGGLMYVEPRQLVPPIRASLAKAAAA
jgi:peroxiredoxin